MTLATSLSATPDKTTALDYALTTVILVALHFVSIEAPRVGLWISGGAA